MMSNAFFSITSSVEKKTYEKLDYNKDFTRIGYSGPALNGAKPKIPEVWCQHEFTSDEMALLGSPRSFYPLNGASTATGNKIEESEDLGSY